MRVISKDSIWIIGLAVSALLLLNIFIPRNPQPQQGRILISEMTQESRKTVDLPTYLSQPKREVISEFLPHLELLGTLIGNSSLAFIYNQDTKNPGLYRLNDTIDDFRIVSIVPGKVTLERNGITHELLLAAGKHGYAESKEVAVSYDDSGTMIINKFQLLSQIMRANELLAKIKILPLPDVSSNKLRGFRIDNVPSGSIIEEAGIRNGDVVYSVQGQKMQSMQDALQMFNKIQNQSRIEIVLLRDDKPVTLHYEIH
jgi:general secretion pathway protein C